MLDDFPARFAGTLRLTLLLVAYPFAPVGPDAVGGAEQVLTTLEAELSRAGHRTIVVAREGSRCRGELVAVRVPPVLDAAGQAEGHVRVRRALAEALARYPVDVMHFHGVDFAAYLPKDGPPALATLHLPPHLYPKEALFPSRPDTWLHCVSESQARGCPRGSPLLDPVPNGVDLEALHPLEPGRPKDSYVLALGRICPEKGFHLALDAARRAGLPLLLGGEVFPYEQHQRYHREQIVPRLGSGARFLGPIGLERKRSLLAAARCLVVSSQTPETSSLVAMEALACGTPVVSFRAGALPEVVEHGRTGLLVDSVAEMANALSKVSRIDPAECRREAERRFSASAMAARYLDRYAQLCLKMVPGR